jgi:hypothetical protein
MGIAVIYVLGAGLTLIVPELGAFLMMSFGFLVFLVGYGWIIVAAFQDDSGMHGVWCLSSLICWVGVLYVIFYPFTNWEGAGRGCILFWIGIGFVITGLCLGAFVTGGFPQFDEGPPPDDGGFEENGWEEGRRLWDLKPLDSCLRG